MLLNVSPETQDLFICTHIKVIFGTNQSLRDFVNLEDKYLLVT